MNPATSQPRPVSTLPDAPHRLRRVTVDEYHRMGEIGLFRNERVELIEGAILVMSPTGYAHVRCVGRVQQWLHDHLAGRAGVLTQSPIQLNQVSEPEPDLTIVSQVWLDDPTITRLPGVHDVRHLIEVGMSSVDSDRNEKLPLYAAHGIPTVWLMHVADMRVEAYADPNPTERRYASLTTYHAGDTIALPPFPDVAATVRDLLPPTPNP